MLSLQWPNDSARRSSPGFSKLGLERAGHQIADRLLRRLALVEHAVHFGGDRHLHVELATQIVGALGGSYSFGHVTQTSEHVGEPPSASHFDADRAVAR